MQEAAITGAGWEDVGSDAGAVQCSAHMEVSRSFVSAVALSVSHSGSFTVSACRLVVGKRLLL